MWTLCFIQLNNELRSVTGTRMDVQVGTSGLTEEDGHQLSHLLRETYRAFKEGLKILAECASYRQASVDRLCESIGRLRKSIL